MIPSSITTANNNKTTNRDISEAYTTQRKGGGEPSISHGHAGPSLLTLSTSPSLQYQHHLHPSDLSTPSLVLMILCNLILLFILSLLDVLCLTLSGLLCLLCLAAQLLVMPSSSLLWCSPALTFQHSQHHPTLPPHLARTKTLGPMTLSAVPPDTHWSALWWLILFTDWNQWGDTSLGMSVFPGPKPERTHP